MTPGRLRPRAVDSAGDVTDRLGARMFVDVTIPRTEVRGRMRLVSRTEAMSIKSEARAAFRSAGLDDHGSIATGAMDDWNAEIAVRHLAVAVRDPADERQALATMDEWRECDDDQIAALWNLYQDHRERLDPLGTELATLAEADIMAIRSASKKKERELLMSFGSRRLSIYLTTLDDPPAS